MEKKKVALLFLVAFLPLALSTYSPALAEKFRLQIVSQTSPFLHLTSFIAQKLAFPVVRWGDFFSAFQEKGRLQRNLSRLKRELVRLREAHMENERLRKLLDFKQREAEKTIACQIIGRDLSSLSHSVILNKGARDGLKEEMPIVTEEGLAGKVIEVNASFARGLLLTDIESRVSGLIQRSRETGLVVGEGGKKLRMQHLDLEGDVKVGDVVVSSGLGSVYPKGILIGWVDEVSRDRNGLFQVAILKPAVRFSRLEEVLCLDSLS